MKGALGVMGAGNTSVLMQLLTGMLDAALARRQDGFAAEQRVAVALKVDEAPLVLNRGFAETMALKRSAGLETVACWQTDAQWIDRDMRSQLDALFAHRVYFATASVEDSRDAASLMMAEFSDTVRPGIRNLSTLGRPDVRLHLPRHSAIASWVTAEGRQAPFVAQTLPLRVDEQRLAFHAARQAERGGRYLRGPQPAALGAHWARAGRARDLAGSLARQVPPRSTVALHWCSCPGLTPGSGVRFGFDSGLSASFCLVSSFGIGLSASFPLVSSFSIGLRGDRVSIRGAKRLDTGHDLDPWVCRRQRLHSGGVEAGGQL